MSGESISQQLCLQHHILLPILPFISLAELAIGVARTCKHWHTSAATPQNRSDKFSIPRPTIFNRARLESLCASPLRLHVVSLSVALVSEYTDKEVSRAETDAQRTGRPWSIPSRDWINGGIHWQLRRLSQALPKLQTLDASLGYNFEAEWELEQNASAAEQAIPLFPKSLRAARFRVQDKIAQGWGEQPTREEAHVMWKVIAQLFGNLSNAPGLITCQFNLSSLLCMRRIWMRFPAMVVTQLTQLRRLRHLAFEYEDDYCEGQAFSPALIRMIRSLPRLQHFEGPTVNLQFLTALVEDSQNPIRVPSIGREWNPLRIDLPVAQALSRLPALTRLTLSIPERSSGLHLLPQFASLRRLQLDQQDGAACPPNVLVDVLSRCNQLTSLSLMHKPLNEVQLDKILSALPSLRELHLGYLNLRSLSFLAGMRDRLESLWLEWLQLYPKELLHIYHLHKLRHLRLTCVVREQMAPEWLDQMFKPADQKTDSGIRNVSLVALEPTAAPPTPLSLPKHLPHLRHFTRHSPDIDPWREEDLIALARAADAEDEADPALVSPLTIEQRAAAEAASQADPRQLLRFKISTNQNRSETVVAAIGEEWDGTSYSQEVEAE